MVNMKKWFSYLTRQKPKDWESESMEMNQNMSLGAQLCQHQEDYFSDNIDGSVRKSKLDVMVENKKDEYISSFTVHGLTRIFKGSKSESIFWLLMLLVGVTLSTFVIHGLVRKYLEYNIYTEVRSTVSIKNIFPGITVCEFNGMLSNYFAYCGQQRGNEFHSADKICRHGEREHKSDVKDKLSSPYEWGNGVFHVTQCHTWGGKYCASDEYLKSISDHNHQCFTINYNGDFHDTYSHAYIEFQLNQTLNYRNPFVIAVVHDPRISELDMTNRVVLETSKIYELKIEKTVLKRLPKPFPSNCTLGKVNDFFPGKYSRRNCLESLTYTRMFKACGDVLDYHHQFIPQELKDKYGNKNKTIKEVIQCIERFSQQEVTGIKECPFPCDEIEYTTMPTFHSKMVPDKIPTYRFHIQYQRVDSYKSIEEKQLVTWDQVAGEVGGLVGLVIGASFISIIEIICYFFLCIFHRLKRSCVK